MNKKQAKKISQISKLPKKTDKIRDGGKKYLNAV